MNGGIYDFKKKTVTKYPADQYVVGIFSSWFPNISFFYDVVSLLENVSNVGSLSSQKKFESKIHHISIEDQGIFGREKNK